MEKMAYRIRTRRMELGLKQADLAAICGVSPTGVAKWERGLTHNLKSEHLFVLADALNVNPRWLAIGEGPKVANSDREAYHFAIAKAVKAMDREQTAWHRIAAAFSRAALLVVALTTSQQGDAAISHNNVSSPTFLAKSLTTIHNLLLSVLSKLSSFGQFRVVKALLGRGNCASRWAGYHSTCRVDT
jgi:transcriptional regulator with XRE-family HTH domain